VNGTEDAKVPQTPTEALAGFLAAASMAAAGIGVAYRPIRIIPFAIAIALLSTALGGRHHRVATAAVFVCTACFVVGTALAVVTRNPIF
jgi:hypothetical protein